MPSPLPDNVVRLRSLRPAFGRRDRARLELVDLLAGLDPDSQQVVLEQLLQVHERIRPHTPTAALLRGEHGPVRWKRDPVRRWLVGPEARRWVQQRASGVR